MAVDMQLVELLREHADICPLDLTDLIGQGFFRENPRYSWVTPKGLVWGVDEVGHIKLAQLMKVSSHQFETAGWLHVSYSMHYHVKKLTRAQENVIERLYGQVPLDDPDPSWSVRRKVWVTPFDTYPRRT